jgi:S-adenosylmethionine-dependent methyltransferase
VALGGRFVDGHYGSLRGRVRTHVIHQHLRAHLAPPPLRIVDVGGGAGHQSIPLAREGYDVTIVDPSAAILERAREHTVAADVDRRVQLVQTTGENAPAALYGERFGAVLCHGVLMYLDDPEPLIGAMCALVDVKGIVSIVAKNAEVMAVRPALEGDWAAALQHSTATARSTGWVSTPGATASRSSQGHWTTGASIRSRGTACGCSPTAGLATVRPLIPKTSYSR